MSVQPPVELPQQENKLAQQMESMARITAAGAKILPPLDIQREMGQITMPESPINPGRRDEMRMELGFKQPGHKGTMSLTEHTNGFGLSASRGPVDQSGSINWKRENYMQLGYAKDGEGEPDGLRVRIPVDEEGNVTELHFDQDGLLTLVTVDVGHHARHDEVGETQESKRKWASDKLGLVLTPGEDGFRRQLDLKATFSGFINSETIDSPVIGTDIKAPRLVFKG
jgi:hypothetical protein